MGGALLSRAARKRGDPSQYRLGHRLLTVVLAGLLASGTLGAASTVFAQSNVFDVQSLDGSGNNRAKPSWGKAGTIYPRVARANYADRLSEPVNGPNARYVSNRTMNDVHQNLFSERGVTQWVFAWGQFLDHTFGLRLGAEPIDPQGEPRDIPFDSGDPLEEFTNDIGVIPFTRSAPARGTGVRNPRQQVNTVSSYIDAWVVYGGTQERLEWLREGPVDAQMSNNGAKLLLADGNLPRRDARGDADSAPFAEVGGRLQSEPELVPVAGDVRAAENIALTATHTLFAREHNRIVSLLPDSLSEEQKFQIARRVVISEQQYITYNEFLPSLGIRLARYTGYKPSINTGLANEFATVGYRGHSFVHGEIELETEADRYTAEELAEYEAMGIEITQGDEIEMAIPLNLAFFNPDLLETLQLGPMLQGLGLEAQYKNDEQIDNQLRSVLFQIPVAGNPECLDGPELPDCFNGVVDLGAVDIERARDHGMPTYNQLRRAYGLAPKTSFTEVTGETTASFPSDPELTPGDEVNDPDSLDFVELFDIDGNPIALDSEEAKSSVVVGVRRTTLAARLQAVYGDVDILDAFVGMLAEPHVAGTEFGELQLAIWKRQFRALRDGDRFFYRNVPWLETIRNRYGIDYRQSLGDIIASNTDIPRAELNDNVFVVGDDET